MLGAYLFPQPVGIGKFQVLGKYGEATYDFVTGDAKQKTSEVDLNYVLKQFNARVSVFSSTRGLRQRDAGQEAVRSRACRYRSDS